MFGEKSEFKRCLSPTWDVSSAPFSTTPAFGAAASAVARIQFLRIALRNALPFPKRLFVDWRLLGTHETVGQLLIA